MAFKNITFKQMSELNSPKLMRDWMLITAGDSKGFNTMLASWGGVGIIWGGPVAFIFVRESRYTKEFIEKSDHFTLTFFDEEYKDALSLCGTVSGRDRDKVKEAKLIPIHTESTTYFSQASVVFNCRKLSATPINPEDIIDKSILESFYKDNDYHVMYIGKIEEILVNYEKIK